MKTKSCDVHMRLYPLYLALVGGPDCLPPEELTPDSPLSSRPLYRERAELDCSCLKQHPDWHGTSSLLFSVLSCHLMDLLSLNLHPLSWHAGSSISRADLNICSHPLPLHYHFSFPNHPYILSHPVTSTSCFLCFGKPGKVSEDEQRCACHVLLLQVGAMSLVSRSLYFSERQLHIQLL